MCPHDWLNFHLFSEKIKHHLISVPIPAAYLSVTIIWSTMPLAIKWSTESMDILFSVTLRMLIAVLLCFILIKIWKIKFPWDRSALQAYFTVGINIYGVMLIVYWSAQFIPSGLISVLFGSLPLMTSLIASLWLKEQSLTIYKLIGMGLGLVGLSVIFISDLQVEPQRIPGIMGIMLAVFIQSISSVWIKRLDFKVSALAITTGGLLIAFILYLITFISTSLSLPITFSSRSLLATLYLGAFGSTIGSILYFYLLKRLEVARLALITLITPVIALLLGQTLNNEIIQITLWIGSCLILSGLAIFQWGLPFRHLHTISSNIQKNKID